MHTTCSSSGWLARCASSAGGHVSCKNKVMLLWKEFYIKTGALPLIYMLKCTIVDKVIGMFGESRLFSVCPASAVLRLPWEYGSLCCPLQSLLTYCVFLHIPAAASSPPALLLKEFTANEKRAFVDCLHVVLRHIAPKTGVNVRKRISAIAKTLAPLLKPKYVHSQYIRRRVAPKISFKHSLCQKKNEYHDVPVGWWPTSRDYLQVR